MRKSLRCDHQPAQCTNIDTLPLLIVIYFGWAYNWYYWYVNGLLVTHVVQVWELKNCLEILKYQFRRITFLQKRTSWDKKKGNCPFTRQQRAQEYAYKPKAPISRLPSPSCLPPMVPKCSGYLESPRYTVIQLRKKIEPIYIIISSIASPAFFNNICLPTSNIITTK